VSETSLILSLFYRFFDAVVRGTMLSVFRLCRLSRGNLLIRHLEVYLVGTTLMIVLLISLSLVFHWVGWVMVIVGGLRILQIVSLNVMSLLFGPRLLSPEVPEKDRIRWRFVAILFSIFDILLIFAFYFHFFNRLYAVLNIGPRSFLDHFYYSMMTLMTVGFGDIVPVSPLGKFLTVLETFMGVFLFLFLVNAVMGRFQRRLDS